MFSVYSFLRVDKYFLELSTPSGTIREGDLGFAEIEENEPNLQDFLFLFLFERGSLDLSEK